MPKSADGQDPGRGQLSPQDRAQFERRVSELNSKLGKVRAEKTAEAREHDGSALRGGGMALGMRMASELVGAVLVGAAIGYGLDLVLGTKPWLLLVFFVLGFVAGVRNVVRGYERLQADIKRETGGNIGTDLAEDDD